MTGRVIGQDIRVTESGMGPWARKDIRAVLARFGISSARRAVDTDATEEVILRSPDDFARIDPREVTIAVIGVLPHTKVWVVEEHPLWDVEDL
jgi:hypothetical protein